MRFILVFVFLSQLTFAQPNFKTIPFGSTTISGAIPQAPAPLKRNIQYGLKQSSGEIKKLEWANASTGAVTPSTVDFAEINDHSFWAQSSQKQNFNQRAANSSVYAFLNQFKATLQINEVPKEFSFVSKNTDDLGFQHIKVKQEYKGIPIYGGELIIHGKGDAMDRINGISFPTPKDLNVNATLTEINAETIVINDLKNKNKYREISPELIKHTKGNRISFEKNIYYDETNEAHLAYVFTVRANGLETWIYLVDAHDGSILKKYKNTCSFLPHDHRAGFISADAHRSNTLKLTNTKSHSKEFFPKTTSVATDLFGKSITLNTYQDGNFYLVDVSRKMFVSIGVGDEEPTGVIWTWDGKNSSPAFNTFNPTLVNSPTNTNWISASAASAHYNAGIAYEYFLSKHNRNSINGRGGNIISIVNIVDEDGKQMDNAFWDGEAMFYGNGAQAFSPLAKALDVAGHELSHGVVQTTANLDYESESGALNESFADIFGRLIDRDDWTMGEEVVKKAEFPTGALRSFIDPHNGGLQLGDAGYQPRIYSERYKGTQDNGGVHINSGIVNWAFYQFVTRINNDLDKAEKIYYRALTQYLTRSSRFIDCRKAVIQSSADLFGANSAETNAAKAAYDAVGILDGTSTNTQQDVQVNPGSNFIVYTDNGQTGLWLADGTGKLVTKLSSKSPLSRPSVTDDGDLIVFVGNDKKIHYISIDWTKGTFSESVGQNESIWRNAIISRQGTLLAASKDVKENKIHVFDYNAQKWNVFELYNPTFSNGVKTESVQYSDAMEFDHTGELVMYDAINTIRNTSGADIEYWDISFLRVYNNPKSTFGDGKISKLFGQLPEKTSVGNPTFSKNSPFIIAFDMVVDQGGIPAQSDYYCLGGNTETGKIDTIFFNSELSWPNYSSADDRVIFNAATNSGSKVVGQVKVTTSKIAGTGTATALISNAKLGVWFANGARKLPTAVENELVIKNGLKVSPNPVTDNKITVQWIQPKASEETRFYVYDIAGKLRYAYKSKFASGSQSVVVPVHDLPGGIYFLKMEIDGKIGSVKFVK